MKNSAYLKDKILQFGVLLCLLFAAPLACAQSQQKPMTFKGGVNATVAAQLVARGVSVVVYIRGPGSCRMDVELNSWNKPVENIGERVCRTGNILDDIIITGIARIENYRDENGSKSFRVRVMGNVYDRVKQFFGGGYDKVHLGDDNRSVGFLF